MMTTGQKVFASLVVTGLTVLTYLGFRQLDAMGGTVLPEGLGGESGALPSAPPPNPIPEELGADQRDGGPVPEPIPAPVVQPGPENPEAPPSVASQIERAVGGVIAPVPVEEVVVSESIGNATGLFG